VRLPGDKSTESGRAERRRQKFTPPGGLDIEWANGSGLNAFSASAWSIGKDVTYSRGTDLITMFQAKQFFPTVGVFGAYKRKADKVVPVKEGISDGSVPGGDPEWKKKKIEKERRRGRVEPANEWDRWLIPKFSDIRRGSRLTTERIGQLLLGEGLMPREREMLLELLFRREKGIAFEFSECGRVDDSVAPPQEIRTIPHEAWQSPGFAVPRHLATEINAMIDERLEAGTLEYCHGPYRNQWFAVKKKNGKHRLVDAAMKYNAVTIRDANLPPDVDEISEEFAGCQITSLIDFYSGYDQISLHPNSRDITAFMTSRGLVRHTTLVQGATNSVAQFVRVGKTILKDHIPERCRIFVDDVPILGPRTRYGDKEAAPGIRRFVLEHLCNLDQVLADIERAGATIGPKSQFGVDGIKLVGYVCHAEGRSPDSEKVLKILDWMPCRSQTEVRAFIGVCVYYRIWIDSFATKAAPLYQLLKKGVDFMWTSEHDLAMDSLKLALTTAPALVRLDIAEGAGLIILAVDASLSGWGMVLMQQDTEKKRHPVRYDSGQWTPAEQNYDATKRECRGVLKALKKVRSYLYGVHFLLETDAAVLVAQLNSAAADLPGALVTRWIAWIRLFDFEVKHVPGNKHTAADGLSRRPATDKELQFEAQEEEIDDFIDAHMGFCRVVPYREVGIMPAHTFLLEGEWSLDSRLIAEFLMTLKRPAQVSKSDFRIFKARALNYRVHNGVLFRRANKGLPERRVVDSEEERVAILQALHDDIGHKGRESTYQKVAERYFWDRCYEDVKAFVQQCDRCQFRSNLRQEEALHPTWTSALWSKVGLDVVRMPECRGKKYLVMARCDLSGWPEGRALRSADSESVAAFLWEDIICRHGIFGKLVVDGGPENKGWVKILAEKYGIARVTVSPYHAPANGMIERGHRPVVEALAKMTDGGKEKWVDNLHAVLLADRVTVKATTGFSPFYLNYGSEAVLPIELRVPTWRIMDWEKVADKADLLALRARQIQLRDDDLEEATAKQKRMRIAGKDQFDSTRQIRLQDIRKGEVVLLHDALQEVDMSSRLKLGYRWLGPFRVSKAIPEKGTFLLEEMDGTRLQGTFAGNRIKVFRKRHGVWDPVVAEENEEEDDQDAEGAGFEPAQQEGESMEVPLEERDEGIIERGVLTRGREKRDEEMRRQEARRAVIPQGWTFGVVLDGRH
jgi:hypothetical protein